MTLAALIAVLILQQPSATAPAETTPGTIRGRVTAADTGKPLRRASVTIVPASDPGGRMTAATNSQGLFEAKNVPPGSYYVSVARGGFLGLQYGQRRPRERGVTVDVRPGATVDKIDIALPRGGVMAGRITDELGEPYPGVAVSAVGTRYNLGKRVPEPAGNATTDDLGQFRIAGLPPGSYYVVASSTETWRTDRKETFGYASTYFPGGSIDLAQLVTLAPSQQRTDLDFSLHASRTGRISGRVQTESGQPVPAPGVSLAYSFPGLIMTAGMRTVRGASDGSFEIKDVAPGVYAVLGGSDEEIVTMAGTDVENLTLIRKTGSTVSGTLVTDEEARPPFQPSGVRVTLIAPTGKVLPTVRVASFEPDWSFKMQGLGGPFLFRVLGLPDGWALGAVRLDDKDITDVPWDVPTGGRQIGGLKIVLTRKIGRISGSVVDEANRPTTNAAIVVFADDETLWMPGSRFVRTMRPDRDGRFAMTGLPPGTYRAIAREYVEEGQWEDPAFLEAARDAAVKFILDEGSLHTLTLKVPSVR
jgi:hypothetical protein